MATKKYYAVKVGRVTGIYLSWEECKKQIDKYSGAIYKGFSTQEEAEEYLNGKSLSNTKRLTITDDHIENSNRKASYAKTDNRKILGAQNQDGKAKGEAFKTVSQKDHNAIMVAYVDGSYNVKTKAFSYGMVILYKGEELKFAKKVEEPSLTSMRNVAGEIKGAEAAMRYAISKECSSLIIYHDYEGISRWCLGEWKANKEGTKAYKAYYDSIKDKLKVTFQKVKGHSGDKYNEMADQLAKSAIF